MNTNFRLLAIPRFGIVEHSKIEDVDLFQNENPDWRINPGLQSNNTAITARSYSQQRCLMHPTIEASRRSECRLKLEAI
jgi:hypothetical protein